MQRWLFCIWPLLSLCQVIDTLEAKVKCSGSASIYVDGQPKGIGILWTTVKMSDDAQVIAVKCTNTGGTGGIIASFGNGLITDSTWRCSGERANYWHSTTFDDSDWNPPHIVDDNRGSKVFGQDDKFSSHALWIWKDGENEEEATSYCRGNLRVQVTIRCDDDATLYADDRHMFDCGNRQSHHVIPRATRVVSIEAHNGGGAGYIVANFSNGFKTVNGSDKWKCSDVNSTGWRDVDFDDSEWQQATAHGSAGDTGLKDITRIWTANVTENSYVYCRGYIYCGCEHQCQRTNDYVFKCLCLDGFTPGPDGYACVDINECEQSDGACSQKCVNTIGSYKCDCKSGFVLGDDRRSCDNIDECKNSKKSTHNCTQECTDLEGSFECGCHSGYELQEDRISCEDIDECKTQNNNTCSQSCNNNNNNNNNDNNDNAESTCSCGHGPCSHVCNNTLGSYLCSCPSHMVLGSDKNTCQLQGANEGGTSTGVIVGVIIPLMIVVAIVLVVLCWKRKRRNRQQAGPPDGSTSDKTANHVYYNEANGSRSTRDASDCSYEDVETRATGAADLEKADVGNPNKKPFSRPTNSSSEDEKPTVLPKLPKTQPTCIPPDNAVYGNVSSDELLSKPIRVSVLASCIEEMRQNNDFDKEFQKIPSGQRGKCVACKRKGVSDLLRYTNIKPYDHSIVKLETIAGKPVSDFINASFIDGYRKQKFYIASQGPTKTTLEDHWRMIWEHDVGIIVMLTNLAEGRMAKCTRYLPQADQEYFGQFLVSICSREISADFTVSRISVARAGEKKVVHHFQFTSWPDKSVPETGTALLQMRRLIKQVEKTAGPPVLVHCSAGVGRTGAYIAIDYLLGQAEAEGQVDVCRCVNLMRENRMNMIQSTEQYYFVHITVLEALQVGKVEIPSSEFVSTLQKLVTNRTGFQEQFKLLETLKQKHPDKAYNDALRQENRSKNRDLAILPLNVRRVFLQQRPGLTSDYINAVFAGGYRSKNDFIVTQIPDSQTCVDFWRMVDDFRVSIIVTLDESEAQQGYYPENESTLTLGPFEIRRTKPPRKTKVVRTQLELKTDKNTSNITHLRPTGWPSGDSLPTDPMCLIGLFAEVQTFKPKAPNKSPILVQCLNGAERSGLFCAMYVMLDKLNAEQVVDIFNSVKTIRADRPQFIGSEEQYIYLHKIARVYMDNFSDYANFK